jgi:2-polyprenyl-3-methyl-5-hydroxy-6-metoxy-1,4-benzoquinol methylase
MIEARNKCYLCGEKMLEILKGFSWLFKCQNCGLVYNPALIIDPWKVSQHFYNDMNVKYRKKIQSVLLKISRIRWNWLIKRLKAISGNLLEVGCGTGEFLRIAKMAGWEVSGLELSSSFRTAALNWYNIELQGAELGQAEFVGNNFDVVALIHVFEHLPDPLEFLNQVSRILKPGGWLFIIVPNLSSWTDNLFGKYNPTLIKMDHYFHYSPSTLRNVISRSFFDVVDVATLEPSHHIWTSLYGFLASKIGISHNLPALVDKNKSVSLGSNIRTNIPYLLGSLSSVFLYPFRFWLEKTNRGHEIYMLCRRR